MKANKSLQTTQPISHLKNYKKYIKPILDANKSVQLTKNGKNCCVIFPDNRQYRLKQKETIFKKWLKNS